MKEGRKEERKKDRKPLLMSKLSSTSRFVMGRG
jgi:hypothetical protein